MVACVGRMKNVIQYRAGVGLVFTKLNTDVVGMLMGSTNLLTLEGIDPVYPDCASHDLRYLPEGSNGMKIAGEQIIHWEFPNFSTLEVPESYLRELYIANRRGIVMLGDDPRVEIGYIANKSDGYGYLLFSCYADKWYSFAHYRRKIYFLGEGYRVGHVEVVGDINVSTHYQGQILLDKKWVNVQRKPLFSQSNLINGHKEGIIFEIHGVEHRIKVEKTHDLVLTRIDENSVVVETCDAKERFCYRKPLFDVTIGDIVECVNTHVIKLRSDKRIAEPKAAYDRIENSLTYLTFAKALRRGLEDQDDPTRYQVKPEHKVILDEKLYGLIQMNGKLVSLQGMFPQYHPRDVMRTVQAAGGILEGITYACIRKLKYSVFVQLVSEAKIDCIEQITNELDNPLCFDFGRKMALEEILAQDKEIVRGVIDQEQLDFESLAVKADVIEAACELVTIIDPGNCEHTKLCSNQMLRASVIQCTRCAYNHSVRCLVDYVSTCGNWDEVRTGQGLYGLCYSSAGKVKFRDRKQKNRIKRRLERRLVLEDG